MSKKIAKRLKLKAPRRRTHRRAGRLQPRRPESSVYHFPELAEPEYVVGDQTL